LLSGRIMAGGLQKRNRERSIADQIIALNVGMMDPLRLK
jgi:hypothetical protein